MKSILSLIAVLVFCTTQSYAAEECFTWSLQDDKATGYRIFRDPSTDVQFVFPDFAKETVCPDPDDATRCKACVPKIEDGKNHRYVSTAFNATNESDYSQWADVIWNQEKTTIPAIEQGPVSPGDTFMLQIPVTLTKVTK